MTRPIILRPASDRPIILKPLSVDAPTVRLLNGPSDQIPGGGGGGGGLNLLPYREIPAGAMDGTNPDFSLTHQPFLLVLVHNGAVLIEGVHFNIAATDISLTFNPLADDTLFAIYFYQG